MSYEAFRDKVNSLIVKAGGDICVRFYHDVEKHKHFANCSDGVVIVGDENILSVAVFWNGKNHAATAVI